MITIYGLVMSSATSRVTSCFLQLGLVPNKDFKFEQIDGSKMKQEPWLSHQPLGQMPYIVDDENGLEMFESRAICKYAAAKIGSPLFPTPHKDMKAFAAFESACSIEVEDFDRPASGIAFELFRKKMIGEQPDLSLVESYKSTLAMKLEGYERVLGKHRYLAGEKMTLADLFHLSYGTKAVDLGGAPGMIDGTLPNVARWWKEISLLESWTKRNEVIKST